MKKLLVLSVLLSLCGFTKNDTVTTRFKIPQGFHQVIAQTGSFAFFLQSLLLKATGTQTKTYNGNIARTDIFTAAVVDISVGKQDLQQCADAVMRLRGEYLFQQKKYDQIAFHFTSGFNCDYIHYANGYRFHNDHWAKQAKKDYSYANFTRYMNLVFSYAGTLSLQKELKPVLNTAELKAGDVFIHGGSPGHCFIVMDVIENNYRQKEFLLAQSFMPAQNIQILQYDHNPWFNMDLKTGIWYGDLVDKAYLRKFD